MSNPDQPEVRISQGVLRGRKKTSILGQTYYSFLGIPYAKPPVGHLRFRAPRPPSNWFGIRDASREGDVSRQLYPHPSQAGHSLIGSEDCLYLNVFTPSVPVKNAETNILKPVMVWFYYGAFAYGNGNPDFYGPDYLLEKDVIVVTFNYRVGPIGFLSLNIKEAPGNAGMKDQVAMLRWVKKEIQHFGGDPNNITLFGESSGGASVHLHMISPLSRGLFNKAILQSATAYCGWAFAPMKVLYERTLRLANQLGCVSQDPNEILEFLRKHPVDKLVWAQHEIVADAEKASAQYFMFLPTIESHHSLDEPFLTEDPRTLIRSGNFYKVPTMCGFTEKEGLFNLFTTSKRFIELLVNGFEDYLPQRMFRWIDSISRDSPCYEKIRRRYFDGLESKLAKSTIHHAEFPTLEKYFTEVCFKYPIMAAAFDMHKYMTPEIPIYTYYFTFAGALGWNNRRANFPVDKSVVAHGDELGYLFHISVLKKPKLSPDAPEFKTIERMTQFWTNFAKRGNPNPDTISPLFPCVWRPMSEDGNFRALKIDEKLEELDSIEVFDFWHPIDVTLEN
ncbi:unnamed protein product [Bemisia tabaci]|uniref:Carboxylic ester hydrolase n=2 Tax=Bemisia tabaci TaxID=7038 RepID=A0A9P0ACX6_BEMTA|nr:unnamed protein product [Bemisia tabaci]